MQILFLYLIKKFSIVIECVIYARNVQIFGVARGNFEIKRLKRSKLRHKLQEESQDTRTGSWASVALTPLPLIVCPRQIVSKLSRIEVWSFRNHLLFSGQQGHPGHFRNHTADRPPKSPYRQIFIRNHRIERNAVGILEGTFQHRLRNLEADEVVIAIRSVAVLGDLRHIEAKLCADMRLWIIGIRDRLSVLRP